MVKSILFEMFYKKDAPGTPCLESRKQSLLLTSIKDSRMTVSLPLFEITHINPLVFADVLLSLVRSKSPGHIRDVRRLVVALSRARLGLYVFCRASVFKNVKELSPAFSLLCERPGELCLVQQEQWGSTDRACDMSDPKKVTLQRIKDVAELGQLVHGMSQELVKQQERHQIEQGEGEDGAMDVDE
jgi:hypothetical protein